MNSSFVDASSCWLGQVEESPHQHCIHLNGSLTMLPSCVQYSVQQTFQDLYLFFILANSVCLSVVF